MIKVGELSRSRLLNVRAIVDIHDRQTDAIERIITLHSHVNFSLST